MISTTEYIQKLAASPEAIFSKSC